MLEFHKYKKIAALIAAVFAIGGLLSFSHTISLTPTLSPRERELYDTSLIWSRGPTGNAAENAAHHFRKHGAEFRFKTEAEYVAAAVAFTTNPPQEVLQNTQRDGDTAFYNPKTAEYAVKSKRGLIRTYFKLDPKIHGFQSNSDYFNAQATGQTHQPANDNQKR